MVGFGIATIDLDGAPVPAALDDRGVTPLRDLVPDAPTSVRELLPRWDEWCDAIAATLGSGASAARLAASEAIFLPPILGASAIYCAGANYHDHVAEMGVELPDKEANLPFHFQLPFAAMTGHGATVLRPPGCKQLDWEAELAVVIGRRADRVSEADALDHIAGYVNANDLSVRDEPLTRHPFFGMNWLAAKGQRTMQPIGPAIVPARFLADPMDLSILLTVDGVVKQRSNTRQMVYSVQEQIAALSSKVPLLPGDVVLTGTPAGTGVAHGHFLRDGDRVVVSIEGLGELANVIG